MKNLIISFIVVYSLSISAMHNDDNSKKDRDGRSVEPQRSQEQIILPHGSKIMDFLINKQQKREVIQDEKKKFYGHMNF